MKHTYAINDDCLFQQENGPDTFDWICVSDETQTYGVGYCIAPIDFNEDAFVLFKDEADCLFMMDNDRPYLVREFVEEAASTYLEDQ